MRLGGNIVTSTSSKRSRNASATQLAMIDEERRSSTIKPWTSERTGCCQRRPVGRHAVALPPAVAPAAKRPTSGTATIAPTASTRSLSRLLAARRLHPTMLRRLCGCLRALCSSDASVVSLLHPCFLTLLKGRPLSAYWPPFRGHHALTLDNCPHAGGTVTMRRPLAATHASYLSPTNAIGGIGCMSGAD